MFPHACLNRSKWVYKRYIFTYFFSPNRAFCRMCISSLTPQWKTSCWAETARSLNKVRVEFKPAFTLKLLPYFISGNHFLFVWFSWDIEWAKTIKSANYFKPDTLHMWLGNSFTCNPPKHGVCVLLSTCIKAQQLSRPNNVACSVDSLCMSWTLLVIF